MVYKAYQTEAKAVKFIEKFYATIDTNKTTKLSIEFVGGLYLVVGA